MSYKLIILESPAKARAVGNFVSAGWRVEASLGHVRDLPEHDLGVDVEHDFALTYRQLPGKQAVVKRLIQAMREADSIYLATDPDREGEAIAWHILQVAGSTKPIYRVTFTSITKAAVLAALVVPRPLDLNLIEAQQTRRAVDRLVGYLASSLTSRALDERASAGRVQSVCLRLVVERERAIAAFSPRRYWSLAVQLRAPSGDFVAHLASVKGNRVEQLSREQADILEQRLTGAAFWVGSVEQTETVRQPAPPFTTASLQQAASKALGLTPDETMRLAQTLYEHGSITYMRTDGVDVTPEAQTAARAAIVRVHGEQYLPAQPPVYHAKAHAQEAHEAIRPTDLNRDTLTGTDHPAPQKALGYLYELIYRRFIASQMTPARFARTLATIHVGQTVGQPYPIVFEARALNPVFHGFRQVYREMLDDGETAPDDATGGLPALANGETLTVVDWLQAEHTTRAPDRYTEAALVQALEQRGIGRPATYAPTIKLVKDKGYVKRDGKRLVPTEAGIRVCDFVVQHFPHVFEFDYTARLEAELDQVAAGTVTRLAVLTAFWQDFQPSLRAVGEVVNRALASRPKPQPVGADCPKCGKTLVKRQSRYGEFVACSGFPKCKFTATADFAERAGIAVAAISTEEGVTP